MSALAGKRIVITRTLGQADELAERLQALGALPLHHPAIAIAPPLDQGPLDRASANLPRFDWIVLTSANAVRALFATAGTSSSVGHARIAAVGPATAAALASHGLAATLVAAEHSAEGLLKALGDLRGQRVLLPNADIAHPLLAEGLATRGALVERVDAYRTVAGPGGQTLTPLLRAGMVDAVTFTSSSTVRFLLDRLADGQRDQARQMLNRTALVCIGPATMQTASAEGLQIAAQAADATTAGIVAALLAVFANQPTEITSKEPV